MKKFIFILLSITCIYNLSFSQNEALRMRKKDGSKEKYILQGKEINVTTNKGEKFEGNFSIKEDSLVITKNIGLTINNKKTIKKTFHIKDLNIISTKLQWLKILGILLIIIGGLCSALLIIGLIQAWAFLMLLYTIFESISLIFLVPITGIVVLLMGKKYKKEKWNFDIKEIIIQI